MAIKKVKQDLTETPAPVPDPNQLPDFDDTQADFDPEALMDRAVRESRDSSFEKLPTGNWIGVVDKIDTWKSEKGMFYRIHLVCNVDENPTFRHIIWCHMLLEDLRTFHEWGPVFYARHLAALGYSKADDQKRVRAEIMAKKPGVIVTSQPNKKNPDWNDVSIRDRIGDDNDEVQLIKSELESQPY